MPTVNPATKVWTGDETEVSLSDKFRKFDVKPIELYEVTCSPDATWFDILAADNIPAAGSLYPGTTNVYAKSAKPKRISPILWTVTVNYEGETSRDGVDESPLLTPAIVDWSDVEVEEEIDEDFDGNPIQTEAGERVAGITAVFNDQVATIKKNVLVYNSYVASAYRRSTNSDTFLGWPPGTAKLMQLTARDVNGEYYELTGVVQFRIPYRTTANKAWYARWRHEGFYHKLDFGANTYIIRALDDAGQPSEKPVLLDANGYRLNDGDPPVWKETKLYGSLPFSAIGFGAL